MLTKLWKTCRSMATHGKGPRYLVRDRDSKFGSEFDRVAALSGIEIVQTAVRSPNMNAHCERFLRGVRSECLDHVLVLGSDNVGLSIRRGILAGEDTLPLVLLGVLMGWAGLALAIWPTRVIGEATGALIASALRVPPSAPR